MADPISLIAFGAAVGGAAGKVAEKAWDSGERWLRERFGSHTNEVQAQARANATQFIELLAARVRVLEENHPLDGERLAEAENHPQFSALLQCALLNSAQTDDAKKHEVLARLVAARLTVTAETTFALASGLAADAISRSTQRQLKLMALCCFLQDIRPREPLSLRNYQKWIEIFLRPFNDFEFKDFDARHLVAIGCASYDSRSERDLNTVFEMKANPICVGQSFRNLIEIELLQFQWDEGLAGVFLTSVGTVVGGLVFDQMTGVDSGMPTLD